MKITVSCCFLRDVHSLAATHHSVYHHEQTCADDRQVESPVHHRRQHDGGRIDGDARAQPTLEQEERRA